MAMCCKGPFLVAFLLCILFCTDLHANRPPGMNGSSDRGTVWFPNLPPQCTLTKAPEGMTLECDTVPFSELFQTSRALGNELVAIWVGSCVPRPPVSLNASCFLNNTNLTHMVLQNCGVMDVAAGTFFALRHLNVLDLSSNMISTVTTDMLAGLGNLKVLKIEDNHISDLKTKQFANMGSLTYLTINGNQIVKIEQGTFYGLSKLKELSLGYNLIHQIDQDAFSGLHSLDYLGLAANKMHFLPKGMFKTIENLTSLNLVASPNLQLKDYSFRDLRALEELSLGLSAIALYMPTREPRVFAGLRNLKLLDLTGVSMVSFEETNLSAVFKDQRNTLRHLILMNTHLSNSLLEMTRNLTNLDWLGLGDNDLLYINQYSLPALARNGTLELDDNKISYIDERAFEGMRNESVWLSRNPLTCNCKHQSFSRWLRSVKGAVVHAREQVLCGGPIDGTRVMDYDPHWWQCSEYMPLVALISTVGFVLIVALILLIGYCNRINLKHWLLERRVASMPADEDPEPPTESGPLLNPALCRNSLRQGKTGAYIIHDIYERHLLDWVNKYIEDQLFNHSMKITLQFPAGPEVIPLWKQVKDFSIQVNAFLVLVTDQFLANHWPEIAEKSGVDNIMKCVFVLHGKKKSDLPKEMRKLPCPCFQWPETGTRFRTLERERDQFWKEVRIAVKVAE